VKIKFTLLFAAAVCLSSCSGAKIANNNSAETGDLQKMLAAAEKYNNSMIYVHPKPFPIYDAGTEEWVDYEKYGEFQNLGTKDYKYAVKDIKGLRTASGEGVYPNNTSAQNSPDYKKFKSENKLDGSHWNFVNTDNYQLDFYKWCIAAEAPAVKLYFAAYALDKAGNYKHAVKAYYACLVFFPSSYGYTKYKTPWYIAPVCISRIKYLTREHPEIGVKLVGEELIAENIYDADVRNDVFYVNPGKLVPNTAKDFERKHIDLSKTGIKKISGQGRIKLVEYNNNHFQLMLDDKPYVVRGITYAVNLVGLTPEKIMKMTFGPDSSGFSPEPGDVNVTSAWTWDDYNKNGLQDAPFEAWVDANRNEKQGKNEKNVGDFALMKEMGVNTLRIYHSKGLNKDALKAGYEKYGFMYLMGNLIGMYAIDNGVGWEAGTDYSDPVCQKAMIESIEQMMKDFKDEPYVLAWVLGNENNFSWLGSNNVHGNPEVYYKFANDCAKLIKSLDPQKRPVIISNGETMFIDYFAKYCPDIDIFGANIYRGEAGFGSFWNEVARQSSKPALITEYGCPSYAKDWTTARREEGQASYHRGNWIDIEENMAGAEGGAGNALGGVIFEWCDEWWKNEGDSDPFKHDEVSNAEMPFMDGYGYEEWFGIVGLGDGKDSTFKRQLRKAYFTYRDLWKKYK